MAGHILYRHGDRRQHHHTANRHAECLADVTRRRLHAAGLLRITALSGADRERQAVRTGRFILSRNGGVIYVGELLKGNEDWKYSVTEDQVRSAFGLITREWSAGDN